MIGLGVRARVSVRYRVRFRYRARIGIQTSSTLLLEAGFVHAVVGGILQDRSAFAKPIFAPPAATTKAKHPCTRRGVVQNRAHASFLRFLQSDIQLRLVLVAFLSVELLPMELVPRGFD